MEQDTKTLQERFREKREDASRRAKQYSIEANSTFLKQNKDILRVSSTASPEIKKLLKELGIEDSNSELPQDESLKTQSAMIDSLPYSPGSMNEDVFDDPPMLIRGIKYDSLPSSPESMKVGHSSPLVITDAPPPDTLSASTTPAEKVEPYPKKSISTKGRKAIPLGGIKYLVPQSSNTIPPDLFNVIAGNDMSRLVKDPTQPDTYIYIPAEMVGPYRSKEELHRQKLEFKILKEQRGKELKERVEFHKQQREREKTFRQVPPVPATAPPVSRTTPPPPGYRSLIENGITYLIPVEHHITPATIEHMRSLQSRHVVKDPTRPNTYKYVHVLGGKKCKRSKQTKRKK